MAMTGVFAEADVADHKQAWVRVLQEADRALDDALVVVTVRALLILRGRDAEEEYRGNADRLKFGCFGDECLEP